MIYVSFGVVVALVAGLLLAVASAFRNEHILLVSLRGRVYMFFERSPEDRYRHLSPLAVPMAALRYARTALRFALARHRESLVRTAASRDERKHRVALRPFL